MWLLDIGLLRCVTLYELYNYNSIEQQQMAQGSIHSLGY